MLAGAESDGQLIAAGCTGSRASATRTGSATATAVEAWSGNGLAIGVADLIKVISRTPFHVRIGQQDLRQGTFGNVLGNRSLHGIDPFGGDRLGIGHEHENRAAMDGVLSDNLFDFQLAGPGKLVASFLVEPVSHCVLQPPAVIDLDVPVFTGEGAVGGLKGFGPGIVAMEIDLVAIPEFAPTRLGRGIERERGGQSTNSKQASHGHPFQRDGRVQAADNSANFDTADRGPRSDSIRALTSRFVPHRPGLEEG